MSIRRERQITQFSRTGFEQRVGEAVPPRPKQALSSWPRCRLKKKQRLRKQLRSQSPRHGQSVHRRRRQLRPLAKRTALAKAPANQGSQKLREPLRRKKKRNPQLSTVNSRQRRQPKDRSRGRKTEIGSQRSEIRSQTSETRGQRSESRRQKSEVRDQKSAIREQRSEDRLTSPRRAWNRWLDPHLLYTQIGRPMHRRVGARA